MNNTTSNPEPENDDFDGSGFTYGAGFVLGIIFLVLSVAFACIRLRRSQNGPNVFGLARGISPATGSGQARQGLDETTLDSFPKLLFSDVQKGGSVSSSCSICYEDYKETDTLRFLPDCGHGFHLVCVDPWLKLHATCPICRSSSVRAPRSSSSVGDGVIDVV